MDTFWINDEDFLLDRLQQRVASETGVLGWRDRAIAKLIPGMMRYTDFKLRHDISQQPAFTRRTYRMDASRAGEAARAGDSGDRLDSYPATVPR